MNYRVQIISFCLLHLEHFWSSAKPFLIHVFLGSVQIPNRKLICDLLTWTNFSWFNKVKEYMIFNLKWLCVSSIDSGLKLMEMDFFINIKMVKRASYLHLSCTHQIHSIFFCIFKSVYWKIDLCEGRKERR